MVMCESVLVELSGKSNPLIALSIDIAIGDQLSAFSNWLFGVIVHYN